MDNAEIAMLAIRMRRLLLVMLAASLICVHSGGSACVYPPPSPRQASETEAQHEVRARTELNSYLKENARKTEAAYFDQAKNVYFARIIRSEEISVDGSPFARQVTLRPLQAIRGSLPPKAFKLRDRELTSCGLGGDGPATWGSVSHIAIVFDDVRNVGMNYRSRTYAVLASETQHPELGKAWGTWKAGANVTYDR